MFVRECVTWGRNGRQRGVLPSAGGRGGLRSYLAEKLGPSERFDVEYYSEGHSNETLFLTWDGRELVLRRPLPGETADIIHDVLREYRVMDALWGTEVPIPETVLACEDHDVLGSDYYLMERLDGDVIRGEERSPTGATRTPNP